MPKRRNGGKKRKWKESANFMSGWSARRKTEKDGQTGGLEEIILLSNIGKGIKYEDKNVLFQINRFQTF